MTDRIHAALLLLCVLSVPVWSYFDWPVVGAESYPSEGRISAVQDMSAGEGALRNAGSMVGGCFQSWSCAANDGQQVASTQGLWLRPVAAVAGGNEAMDTALASEPVGKPSSVDVPTPPATATREPSDRSGRVTWVHPSLHGNIQADGSVYSRWNAAYAASMDYELGTVLEIRHGENAIVVEVQDRGILGRGHVDVSEAGFVQLAGDLDIGVIEVSIQEAE